MVSFVVPTIGRPSLALLLHTLAGQLSDRSDVEILVVDDRRDAGAPLDVPDRLLGYTKVLRGRGTGPAAARNLGWQAARHEWVVFLDDDVTPAPDWIRCLHRDLDVPGDVAGVQGTVRVPLPADRRPTDWERSTAGLAAGRWITADMAYRRDVLASVGGFDERFTRAYREDADLAARVRRAGWRLVRGDRVVVHPIRPEGRWVSLRTQRGNADDALLRRRYGRSWRAELAIPPGRRPRHAAVTAMGALALVALIGSRRRVAALAGTAWLAGTAEFAWARIAPGPRTPAEIATMAATSVLIPPLAVTHWLRGWWHARGTSPWYPAADISGREDTCVSR
jgi:GT2 family glycosyltransferase